MGGIRLFAKQLKEFGHILIKFLENVNSGIANR